MRVFVVKISNPITAPALACAAQQHRNSSCECRESCRGCDFVFVPLLSVRSMSTFSGGVGGRFLRGFFRC